MILTSHALPRPSHNPFEREGDNVRSRTVSVERLKELLDHDPVTGILTHRSRPGALPVNNRFAGKRAGGECPLTGYRFVTIDGVLLREHRVCWAMFHGKWPEFEIDHINHNRADNRIVNLRDVPIALNQRNKSRYATNTSGHVGVSWCKRTSKWRACIWNKKTIALGSFDRIEDAIAARQAASARFSYNRNHGGA